MAYNRPGKKGRPHPADVASAHEVSIATKFATHFRKGPHESYTEDFDNLPDARAKAVEYNALYGGFGRRSMVYAISKSGARYPVPDSD